VIFRCVTHNVTVTISGDKRKFKTPPGSWAGMSQCRLKLLKEIREGTFGNCVVEKVG